MHKNMRRSLMILYLQESLNFTDYSLAIRKYLSKLRFRDKIYLWDARTRLIETYNKNWRRNGN